MKLHFLTLLVISLAVPLPVLMAEGGIPEEETDKPQPTSTPEPILCRGHYHSEEEAVKQLARMAATYSNLDGWQARAENIRKQILLGAKLDPLPERTPLNSVIHKKRSYDGYTVESAAFEARPGYFVYGNLYRPGQEGPASRCALSARPRARPGGRTLSARPATPLRHARPHGCRSLLLRHDWIRRFRTLGLGPRAQAGADLTDVEQHPRYRLSPIAAGRRR